MRERERGRERERERGREGGREGEGEGERVNLSSEDLFLCSNGSHSGLQW